MSDSPIVRPPAPPPLAESVQTFELGLDGGFTWHAWINLVLGIPVILGLMWWVSIADADGPDFWTIGMLGLVSALWLVWTAAAFAWSRRKPPADVEVEAHSLLRIDGLLRLPAAAIEPLADRLAHALGATPPRWLGIGATVIISAGLAGTFFGLAMGLINGLPELVASLDGGEAEGSSAAIAASLEAILGGAKLAFVKSLAGVVLGTLWSLHLVGLRGLEQRRLLAIEAELRRRFPPIHPEQLSSRYAELQNITLQAAFANFDRAREAERQERLADHRRLITVLEAAADRTTGAVLQLSEGQGLAAALGRANQQLVAGLEPQHEVLRKSIVALGGGCSLANLQAEASAGAEASAKRGHLVLERLDAQLVKTAEAIAATTALGGGMTLAALAQLLDSLSCTVTDLRHELPEKIGAATGEAVGQRMSLPFDEVTRALGKMSEAGGQALGDTFKEGAGQQAAALGAVLDRVCEALESLPQTLAESGRLANETLTSGAKSGADRFIEVGGALAEQAATSRDAVTELQIALAGARALVEALGRGSDELGQRFEALNAPLVALPEQLRGAEKGLQQVNTASERAAGALDRAGEKLKESAAEASAALDRGGVALQRGADAAAAALDLSGADLARTLSEAKGTLAAGFTDELQSVRETLRDQAEHHRRQIDAGRGQADDQRAAAEAARAQLLAISERSADLLGAIDRAAARVLSAGDGAGRALDLAASEGAARLGEAAGLLVLQTEVNGAAAVALREGFAGADALLSALRSSSAELVERFEAVGAPLSALPEQLRAATSALQGVNDSAGSAASALSGAGASISDHAQAAAGHLERGGARLADGMRAAGSALDAGMTSSLGELRASLDAQRGAQETLLQQTQLAAQESERRAHAAKQQWAVSDANAMRLSLAISEVCDRCEQTIKALERASGQQEQGAGDAVAMLLSAVESFQKSLDRSGAQVHAASMATVASAEQLSLQSAREVAEALAKGARSFEDSVQHVNQTNAGLAAQARLLEQHTGAAARSVEAMRVHGDAMVASGGALGRELSALTVPLSAVHAQLSAVPGAVSKATEALKIEGQTFAGVGDKLSQQAALITAAEKSLQQRTEVVEAVSKRLVGGLHQHVEGLAAAQKASATAWAEAVNQASGQHALRAREIGDYAQKVHDALGLKQDVQGLQGALEEVAKGLEPLRGMHEVGRLPAQIAALQRSVDRLSATLGEPS